MHPHLTPRVVATEFQHAMDELYGHVYNLLEFRTSFEYVEVWYNGMMSCLERTVTAPSGSPGTLWTGTEADYADLFGARSSPRVVWEFVGFAQLERALETRLHATILEHLSLLLDDDGAQPGLEHQRRIRETLETMRRLREQLFTGRLAFARRVLDLFEQAIAKVAGPPPHAAAPGAPAADAGAAVPPGAAGAPGAAREPGAYESAGGVEFFADFLPDGQGPELAAAPQSTKPRPAAPARAAPSESSAGASAASALEPAASRAGGPGRWPAPSRPGGVGLNGEPQPPSLAARKAFEWWQLLRDKLPGGTYEDQLAAMKMFIPTLTDELPAAAGADAVPTASAAALAPARAAAASGSDTDDDWEEDEGAEDDSAAAPEVPGSPEGVPARG